MGADTRTSILEVHMGCKGYKDKICINYTYYAPLYTFLSAYTDHEALLFIQKRLAQEYLRGEHLEISFCPSSLQFCRIIFSC